MSLFLDPLFSSIAIGHFMVDTFNASRPVLLTFLGMRESEIALISTIYIWASSLSQPLLGWLSDRIGPRWLAAGGVLWMAGFFSAALFIPGSLGLVCLIIAALGSGAYHPVGTVQATLQGRDRLKGRETTAASLFFMAGQSGWSLGPIITGLILVRLGLHGLIILPIISLPICASLAWQLRSNTAHPKSERASGSFKLKTGIGFVFILAVVATMQSWAQTNLVNLMPKYLADLGQSPAIYGSIAGLFMGGSALGNVVGGHLGDRFPKRQVAAGALFLAAFPIYIISRLGWSNWLYLLIPLAGAMTGSVHSIMVVLAQRLIPGSMALASGLILGFIFSAGALGLLYTGVVAETQGFPLVLLMTTGMVLIAAPLALLLKEDGINLEPGMVRPE